MNSINEAIEATLGAFLDATVEKRRAQLEEHRGLFADNAYRRVTLENEAVLVRYGNWFYRARIANGPPSLGLTKEGYIYRQLLQRDTETILAAYRADMIAKISAALLKHGAKRFEALSVTVGRLGIEGIFRINAPDERVEFRAILAGGYNIQRLHYRYTVRKF